MNVLARDPDADQLHREGLAAALDGRFDDAYDAFHEAYEAIISGEPSAASTVQTARIMRDEGFTHVRFALAECTTEPLHEAAFTLGMSRALTEPMVGPGESLLLGVGDRPGAAQAAKQEINAEHAATLGCLGRLVTAKNVFLGIDTRGDGVLATWSRRIEQAYYAEAYRHAWQGSNGYYLTSIAVTAARQEVLNGRPVHAKQWLARAAMSIGWTVSHDPATLGPALITTARRLPGIRSYDAAKQSALTRP